MCLYRKGLAVAVWRPELGAFEVVERGRQVFNGQGESTSSKAAQQQSLVPVSRWSHAQLKDSMPCCCVPGCDGLHSVLLRVHMALGAVVVVTSRCFDRKLVLSISTEDMHRCEDIVPCSCCRVLIQQEALPQHRRGCVSCKKGGGVVCCC